MHFKVIIINASIQIYCNSVEAHLLWKCCCYWFMLCYHKPWITWEILLVMPSVTGNLCLMPQVASWIKQQLWWLFQCDLWFYIKQQSPRRPCDMWAHVKPLKSNKSWPNRDNSIMDILDILLDILLKPPQPLMGLFLPTSWFIKRISIRLKLKIWNLKSQIAKCGICAYLLSSPLPSTSHCLASSCTLKS